MSQPHEDLRAELAANRSYLLSVASQIEPGQTLNSTENPLWNVHDMLAHLAVSERGLQATVKRFLTGEALPEGFSLDYWNQRQVGKLRERPMEELLASLQGSRAETLTLLDMLTEDQLAVRGIHPAGFETNVAGVFRVMARHERAHGQEIAAALGLEVGEPVDWSGLGR